MGEPQQNNQNRSSERLSRGIVARGRTIDVGDPTAPKLIAGYSPDTGKPMTKLATRTYGPGQEVELPVLEIKSLRERGFLIDPDMTVPPLADGPHFSETGHHASAV